MPIQEPVMHLVPLRDLRPTQMTVGFREVRGKLKRWRQQSERDGGGRFLGAHMIPVILGPKKRRFVIDHHHLARALLDGGVQEVLTSVVADLHHLDKASFWTFADHRGWVHPYDAEGVRRSFGDLPRSVDDLADDPFRSLAGELRRAGGYAKDPIPFSEFLWADFLRKRLKRKLLETDFERAIRDALQLARGKQAAYLPGWCGPTDE